MSAPAKTFEDSLVWQKAHSFVLMVYKLMEVRMSLLFDLS